jgi:VIT1/CCC1 family predicted Fe2+/Mn2+ transporter
MNIIHSPITHTEENNFKTNSQLNWLRAAVLGANDGIVSVAAVVVGMAGVSNSKIFILTAGVAALVAGALSMAVGEYVSVSSQRDTEKALLKKHPDDLTNPFHAACASAIAFFFGAIIPIIAILISPASMQIGATFFSAILALIITGLLSAYIGRANKMRAVVRVVLGGLLAMAITFGIGKLFGVVGI